MVEGFSRLARGDVRLKVAGPGLEVRIASPSNKP